MQPLIDAKAALPPAETIEEMRTYWAAYAAAAQRPYPDGMVVRDCSLPRGASMVPARLYRTKRTPAVAPCILYFHGGGFMKGNLDSSDTTAWGLCEKTAATVVSVDYRLAPENPYPAAFEDCYAALVHIAGNPAEYGIDGRRIALCGDSAGGNLAAAVCLAARDCDGPHVAAQALIYPCLTDGLDTPAYRMHAETPGLTTAAMSTYWDWYLGPRQEATSDPYAAPLKAADLSALPPAYIHIAEIDPLADDGRVYAERLEKAGGRVQFRCAKGMIHGFLRARLIGPDADSEFASICRFLKDSLQER
jgi:acetyl esterase